MISAVLLTDVDVMVLRDFWTAPQYFHHSHSHIVASPDLYVGYKEQMEEEFRPYDATFRLRRVAGDGWWYFNTGVLFISRKCHSEFLASCVTTWLDFISLTGKAPRLWDQHIFNYRITRDRIAILPLSPCNNCLRQYPFVLSQCGPSLHGEYCGALHFNGGEPQVKHERWLAMEVLLSR
jgi:hypothetical protein